MVANSYEDFGGIVAKKQEYRHNRISFSGCHGLAPLAINISPLRGFQDS
jgi:hypothetical protein